MLYFGRFSPPKIDLNVMKLIGSQASPYVRKVRIVMAEKKIDFQFVVEDPWAENSPVSRCLVSSWKMAVQCSIRASSSSISTL
jgi:hypothetical protein